jgi:hypothetical protein
MAAVAVPIASVASVSPAAAAPVVPGYVPLSPARLLDTRAGQPTVDGAGSGGGALGPGESRPLAVLGRGGVPATGVAGVVVNVTVVAATAGSFVTVYPSGAVRPYASNLNAGPGQVVANLVVAGLGSDGRVALYNDRGVTDLVADVAGWFPAGGAGVGLLPPARLLDSRPPVAGGPPATVDGQASGTGPVTPADPYLLTVTGRGGVPGAGVGAVVLNVTATGASEPTFVTVHPSGQAAPTASNLNVRPGRDVANLVVAQPGSDGRVALANGRGAVHLVADVVAWFAATPAFTAVPPARLVDTRPGGLTADGTDAGGGPLGPGAPPFSGGAPGSGRAVVVAGRAGVPATGVGAVVVNVTGTQATEQTFATVHPHGRARPGVSNLNLGPDQDVPNLVIARVGIDGRIVLYNEAGWLHVVVDVVGWFPAVPTSGPVSAWGCPEFDWYDCATVPADRIPVAVEGFGPGNPPVAVAAGEHHHVALLQDGSVVAWGDNVYGQLGTGSTYSSPVPVPVSGLGAGSGVMAVAAGATFSAALRTDGTVLAWGGPGGEVWIGGDPQPVAMYPPRVPTEVPGLGAGSGVTRLVAESYLGGALKADGTLVIWLNPPVPEYVQTFATGVADVDFTSEHLVLLRTDGSVLAVGQNTRGQLGTGDTAPVNGLTPVVGLGPGSGVVEVKTAPEATYARKADGTVLGWGSAQVGQPSMGPAVTTPTPVAGLGPGSGVTALAPGRTQVLALMADGTVLGWGGNTAGQTGTPSPDRVVTPTPVPGTGPSERVRLIAAQADHSLAVH